MKIMFIQHGDFREAYRSFERGHPETYKAQRYSVDFVVDMAQKYGCEISVLCVKAKEKYNENLCRNVKAVGIQRNDVKNKNLINEICLFNPTHIILRTPIIKVIKYALNKNKYILPLFADYFSSQNIFQWYKNRRLSYILNNNAIPVVSNHNIPACESLAKIGVTRSKVLPWDWPQNREADGYPIRDLPSNNIKLLYVGVVSEEKGTFDCLAAMSMLKKSSNDCSLKIIGPGELEKAEKYRVKNRLDNVEILGRIANDVVLNEMREADIVIVPSRHKYPEGMPNTIYEALSMKTPLIMSDHPVFNARFTNIQDVIFFKASNPSSLSDRIEYLIKHPEVYSSLSEKSLDLLSRLEAPLKWGNLISTWINGSDQLEKLRLKYNINNDYK